MASMSGYGRTRNLARIYVVRCAVVLGAAGALLLAGRSHAGEAFITKARSGGRLTIDQGAEAGLVVGTEVSVVRPPGEPIIHPVSGENLGAPEIVLGVGEITRTSARAASVVLRSRPLLAVEPGDMVRFTTSEEEMIMDQERSMIKDEQAQKERQQLQSSVSELKRGIRSTQATINELRGAIKRLDRIDDALKVQLRGINEDISTMKEDLLALRETVNLMGAVPVGTEGEEGAKPWIEEEENIERLQAMVRALIQDQMPAAPAPADIVPGEPDDLPPMDDELGDLEEEESEEEKTFLQKFWYYLVALVVGVFALLFYLYMKMSAGEDEEEEDEEEEDEEEEEEEEDEDFEVEEEDDIVVEETAS